MPNVQMSSRGNDVCSTTERMAVSTGVRGGGTPYPNKDEYARCFSGSYFASEKSTDSLIVALIAGC